MFFKLFIHRVGNVLARDFIVAIISFLMTTYLANTLGAQQFGLWVGCLTFLLICDLIFRLKIDQLIVYFSKKYPLGKNLYLKVIMLNFYSAVFAGILIFFFKDIIISFFSFSGLYFLILIFFNFFISIFGNIILYIFLAESNYRSYNFCILSQAVVNALLILILFQIFEKSLLLPLISLTSSWVTVIIFFMFYRIYHPIDKKNNRPLNLTNKEIIEKGSYIYLSAGMKIMSDQAPRLFAISFLSPSFVGFIGLAQVIIGLLNRLPIAINTILFPMLVNETSNQLSKTLAIIRVLLIIFAPIIIILEMAIPYLINILYGSEYNQTISYIQILLPFMYLGLPGLVLSSYYASKGMFKTLLIINCYAVISSVLALFLISFLSVNIAPVISLAVVFLVISISSIKYLKDKILFEDFIPSKKDAVVLMNYVKSIFIRQ